MVRLFYGSITSHQKNRAQDLKTHEGEEITPKRYYKNNKSIKILKNVPLQNIQVLAWSSGGLSAWRADRRESITPPEREGRLFEGGRQVYNAMAGTAKGKKKYSKKSRKAYRKTSDKKAYDSMTKII